jgi:group I intron endonuclease
MYSIYKVTNRVTGMSYIGVTRAGLKSRWRGHYSFAEKGLKYPLAQAIRDHGRDAFEMTEIGTAETQEDAYAKEKAAIVLFGTVVPSGYNLAHGGAGLTGRIVTAETRAKISAANMGRTGTVYSAESRKKMGDSRRGAKNWQARAIEFQGVTYPSVTDAAKTVGIPVSSMRYRLKVGVAHFVSPRTVGANTGLWNRGKTASPETRAKMSAARKGAKNWNARVIEINGQTYPSTTDAMAALGCTREYIRYRIRHGLARYLTDMKRVH